MLPPRAIRQGIIDTIERLLDLERQEFPSRNLRDALLRELNSRLGDWEEAILEAAKDKGVIPECTCPQKDHGDGWHSKGCAVRGDS